MISESRNKKRSLESELIDLMDTAQHTQLEIECINDKFLQLENYMRSSSISHLTRIENMQLSIEKAKKDVIPYSTIDNLELVVEGIKKSEKEKKAKLMELIDLKEAEESKISSQRELERISEERIKELKYLSSNCVPYDDIRGMVCETCSKAIKVSFREMIVNGNSGNESILKSVISCNSGKSGKSSLVTRNSLPGRKSESKVVKGKKGAGPDSEACNCRVF